MLNYVNSFQEVEQAPVLYGDAVIFFDNNKDRFYIKAVDTVGKKTIGTYDFKQVENPKPLSSEDFVPRAQFDALSQKMDMLMELLTAPTQPKTQEQTFQQNQTQNGAVENPTPMVDGNERKGRNHG